MIPSDIRYIHERAKAYQMIEDHEKAVEDFSLVIKKNPKNAHAHFRRAFSLKALQVSLFCSSTRGIQRQQRTLKRLRHLTHLTPRW